MAGWRKRDKDDSNEVLFVTSLLCLIFHCTVLTGMAYCDRDRIIAK